MIKGKIIKQISDFYTIKTNEGIDVYKPRGNFKVKDVNLLVGDDVLVDFDKKLIKEVLPRKNELFRPKISNVDLTLIIASVKKPNLDLNLIDKLLTITVHNNITPAIMFTKVDLLKDHNELNELIKYYKGLGIKVTTNKDLTEFDQIVKNKEVVLAGQSGAGKSTLLNRLDDSLNIVTNEISLRLGRGKHTTRHTELFPYKSSLIADTPGFSNIDLSEFTKLEIERTFLEFRNYPCEFRNCLHDKELNCNVKDNLEKGNILQSRYDNYIKFIKEGK